MNLGAKQCVEQRIRARGRRGRAVGDEHAPEAEPRRRRRGGAHVVGLDGTDGDQGVRTARFRVGGDQLQLAYLVAAEPKGNGIVALDEQPRRAAFPAKRLAQPRHLLDRSRRREQPLRGERREAAERIGRATRGRNGVRHRRAPGRAGTRSPTRALQRGRRSRYPRHPVHGARDRSAPQCGASRPPSYRASSPRACRCERRW